LRLGVGGVLLASLVVSLSVGLLMTTREMRKAWIAPSMHIVVRVCKFGLPFIPTALCFLILHHGDRFFLVHTVSNDDLGIYSFAYRIAMAVGAFTISPMGRVWGAQLYDAYAEEDAEEIVGRMLYLLLSVYVFAACTVLIFKVEVLAILGPIEYRRGGSVLVLLFIGLLFYNASILAEGAFYVYHRTQDRIWIFACSSSVMLGLYAWLIPVWKVNGAALATLLGYGVHCVLIYWKTQKIFWVRYDWRRISGLLCVSGCASAAALLMDGGEATLGLRIAVWFAFVFACWILDLLPEGAKAWVRGVIG